MFTTPCFIQKCTPILIEKLVELGYKIDGKTTLSYGIFCNNGKIKICSTNEQPSIKNKNFIQCYDNEELFLALAVLRDDTDKYQYFICDKVSVTLGKTYYPGDYLYYQYDEFFDKQNWHKATVEELIEHFTMEGGIE